MASRASLLLTCEHGGNAVPAPYRALFRGHAELLASHRGWDIGALSVAKSLARALSAPLCAATVSRLVVDLNRSPNHRALFSEQTRGLSQEERARLVARHYLPHRERVLALVRRAIAGGRALHLAVHSFTPELDGKQRHGDVGLLYDPRRASERDLCRRLGRELARDGVVHVRMNYPYLGTSDGLTTHLRGIFPASRYAGVEIEINQRIADDLRQRRELGRRLAAALRAVTS